jgi:osmoprotectant transport system substrate-binding protein
VRKTLLTLFILFLLTALLAACGGSDEAASVRIGSKEFTEQHLLGNMYEMLLDDAGFDATYTAMGGTSENHTALMEGEIDLYPEYTGTALLTQLEMDYDPSMSADDVYQTVKDAYEEQYDLTLLDPTQFNNTYCLTMPQAKAQEMGISTVADLQQNADGLVFGTTQEFVERPDGLPGLEDVYGSFNFDEVVALDPGLLYTGIDTGDIDVTTCFGTDGQIAAYDLVVLEDNMGFWPPYPAAPVVRMDVLDENPGIADALNPLSARLDGDTMQQLNWEVSGNGREADEVAREFLVNEGLISE